MKIIQADKSGKPKALYLEQKNVNLVINSLVGEVSHNRCVGMEKGKRG